jgi:hypothetical protein
MVVYDLKTISSASAVTGVPSIAGEQVYGPAEFLAWQPSTWPSPPAAWDSSMISVIRRIFEESMLDEIDNVIADAKGDLRHRGHVVAIALLCALDTVSSYGYGAHCGAQIPEFVRTHFPAEYRAHGKALLELYRHAMVHSWNLFGAAVRPGNDTVTCVNNVLSFGLLNLRGALAEGIESYLEDLKANPHLQGMTLLRYTDLRSSAVQV